jgi:twitching motility two-component system response regulator PilH
MEIAIGLAGLVIGALGVYLTWLGVKQSRERKREQTHARQKVGRREKDEKQHTILIIEDDYIERRGLAELLGKKGFRCSLAHNVGRAKNLIRSRRFDLITLDMQLTPREKGQSGYLLLDEIAKHQEGVPVIIVSMLPWSGTEVRDFLRKHGAYDYVRKPVEVEKLLESIESALGR